MFTLDLYLALLAKISPMEQARSLDSYSDTLGCMHSETHLQAIRVDI